MLEFFQDISQYFVLGFVVLSMLNVGLTQKPAHILRHLRNKQFLTTMLVMNLIIVPALMIYAVTLVPLARHYATGLLLFGMAAGAPFLIHLTKTSNRDLALGATVLMVLMVGTVITMPIVVPLVMEGVRITPWQIMKPMLIQMILPMVVGMLLTQFFESFCAVIQPWVAKVSNIALHGLILTTGIGYSKAFLDVEFWKALATGLVVLVIAFFIGYMTGDGHDQLKDVGGLATAQRGTASAMIVASSAFNDPRIMVIITLLNTVAVFFLIFAAKQLSSANEFRPLTPIAADVPRRYRAKADQTWAVDE